MHVSISDSTKNRFLHKVLEEGEREIQTNGKTLNTSTWETHENLDSSSKKTPKNLYLKIITSLGRINQ